MFAGSRGRDAEAAQRLRRDESSAHVKRSWQTAGYWWIFVHFSLIMTVLDSISRNRIETVAQAIQEKPGFVGLLRGPLARGSREGALLVISAVAIYLLVSIASYYPGDPGWSNAGHVNRIVNQGGVAGAWIADVLLYLFGFMAYLFPVMIGYAGWLVYRGLKVASGELDVYHATIRAAGCVVAVCAGCGLATLHYHGSATFPVDAGGIIGTVVGSGLAGVVNPVGGTLFLLALFLTGVTLFTGLSWLDVMDVTGRYTILVVEHLYRFGLQARTRWVASRRKEEREARIEVERERKSRRKPPRIEPVIAKVEPSERAERERQVPLFKPAPGCGALPPLALLDEPKQKRKVVSDESLEAISRQVELKLADFGIEAEVVAVHPGPVVTRYELQPAPGLKVSRVTNLSKDLARSLSTVSVRIVEVIPGKTTIGLEIPNEEREIVVLSDVLKSSQYDADASHLALGLGKDISGQPVVVDLASMPHLLVAGTTGAGKSVAINAMILSLLYKASSSDVRMIMIDPKMLELSVYEGIPHLLAPVVTDMKHASNALRWCVVEMDRRYRLMSTLGVRNIGGYNRKVSAAADSGTPLKDPFFQPNGTEGEAPVLTKLPFIVVVVDELADMMMLTGKNVEELIARLAQKARAAGIHLILATQRPSVDVITGLIKANIPSRIAFQVSSKVDSRTILDQMGAEHLLGHGDMLYMGPGVSAPSRVHGAFVADHEVHKVVKNLKQTGTPSYLEGILDGTAFVDGVSDAGGGAMLDADAGAEADPLYDQAVRIVTETRRASISGVQRRLKIGYNRAARMLEEMEHAGVVGPLQSNGSREVLAPPPPGD